MLFIVLAAAFLSVFGQRSPNFFSKPDHETTKPFKIDLSVFEKLDYQLQKYNKYEEFKEFTDQIKEKKRIDPSRTAQDELREVLQWSKNLDRPTVNKRRPELQPWGRNPDRNVNFSPFKPSPGMNAYWGETEQKKRIVPKPGPFTPRTLTGKQVMNLALRNLESVDAKDKKSPMERFPEVMKNLPRSLPTELLQAPIKMLSNSDRSKNVINILPKKDDYNSPIRWVSLDSNDTRDGLAKVTDPRTGKNQQYILNETIFVPVIDYSIERLGLTTTHRPVLTTDNRELLTVARSIDIKTLDERDWLAFESALGGRNESNQCHTDGCQSRCKTLACESVCRGDTCASGCIGGFCNTFCKGPGCLSMCIGESCTAKCEGLSCESRCRGDGCEAGCRTFSCTYAINGRHSRGGGSWSDHYPQYDDNNIRNTQF